MIPSLSFPAFGCISDVRLVLPPASLQFWSSKDVLVVVTVVDMVEC